MQSGERFWFLTGAVTIHLAQASNPAGLTILEHRCLRDFGPPLHIHHDEDETFHILAGEMRFRLGDVALTAGQGDTVFLPRAVPHGFRVVSDEARFLTMTHGRFEQLIRDGGRPAAHDDMPDQTPPSPEMQQWFAGVCSANGIDLIGPPID